MSNQNLSAHSAVDGEVDGIRQGDEEIGEEDQDVDDGIVEDAQFQGSVENVQNGEDGQRDLHHQEAGDDDDEHQGRAVGITQLAALAGLAVLFEELVALLLGTPQGSEQEHVEQDQGSAGSQVDANHPEPKVQIVVDHLYFYFILLFLFYNMNLICFDIRFNHFIYLTEDVGDPIGFVLAAGSHDSFAVPADLHR
jgi:hypothetical protein